MNTSTMSKFAIATIMAVTLGTAGYALAADAISDRGYTMTPEQETKLLQIEKEYYSGMDATRQQLVVKQAELQAQLQSVSPDKGKVESLSREIGALEGTLLNARVDFYAKLNKENIPNYRQGSYYRGSYSDGCPMMGSMHNRGGHNRGGHNRGGHYGGGYNGGGHYGGGHYGGGSY